jgi:predicted small metal-binding protein
MPGELRFKTYDKKGEAKMKVLSCREVGADCDFVARAKTQEEVLRLAAEHGRKAHDMREISEDMKAKIVAAIREE